MNLRRQKTSPDTRTWAAGAYNRGFKKDLEFFGSGILPDNSTEDTDFRRANTEKSALEIRKEIVANQFLERELAKRDNESQHDVDSLERENRWDTMQAMRKSVSPPTRKEKQHMKPTNNFEDITEEEFDRRERLKAEYRRELQEQMRLSSEAKESARKKKMLNELA